MESTLKICFFASGFTMVFSGLQPTEWWKIVIGIVLIAIAEPASKFLTYRAEPNYKELTAHHAERKVKRELKKKRKDYVRISEEYFKATFVFAGYIAQSSGAVCNNEKKFFNEFLEKMQLNRDQNHLAHLFFNDGCGPNFDYRQAFNEFFEYCGGNETLCENFLQTQFSFAQSSGSVELAEIKILEYISDKLETGDMYKCLIQEYREEAQKREEESARQRFDDFKRERDKRKEAEERARIDAEQKKAEQDKLKKLSPAQREVHIAFAVLGIKPTKDASKIKRAYRSQIKRHHPDYLLAQGYPPELLYESTQRSIKINKSYGTLKKRLKFK